VTTIDAAAAWLLNKRLAIVALTVLLGTSLQGCGSGSSLFESSSPSVDSTALLAPAQPAPAQARIAIAPVIGAPEAVAKQLSSLLTEATEKQRIGVAKAAGEKVDYTVRGYVVAAREKNGTKISYIWDVTDGTGKRVNRITGEELASAPESRDPWSAVTPQIMQSIAAKTATSLGTWLPTQAVAASGANLLQTASVGGSAGQETSSQPPIREQTAAIPAASPAAGRDGISAIVPSVTGAPGDGSSSLAAALQQELRRNGVSLVETPSGTTYKVEGKVKLGQSKDGKQPIQIDWVVKDPKGKQLGTVSQKNEIPEGSLDGSWGKVADMAAAAAAQGILKLLPQTKAIN